MAKNKTNYDLLLRIKVYVIKNMSALLSSSHWINLILTFMFSNKSETFYKCKQSIFLCHSAVRTNTDKIKI